MKTKVNEPIKVNNKNGIDFYYEIEQFGKEQSYDDRLIILDSKKQYFNDFLLQEDDREEEIKGIVKTLEETDLKEMCYVYDYQIFDSLTKLSQYAYGKILTRDEIFDAGYTNVFRVNGKTLFTLKREEFIDEENVDMTNIEYSIKDVGFDGSNYTKDDKGRYVMSGTIYGIKTGEIYETEDDFDFTYDADTKEITITNIDEIFSINEIDEIKSILLDNLKLNFKGE